MEIKEIVENGENGELQVQIAPIGSFIGSDSKGNPINENITVESLQKLANGLNESGSEVLVDKDHASMKPGVEKDTHAQGWLSKFIVDPIKGLLGILKFTKSGRESVDNREYRFLSPVFKLNEDGNPVSMHSVAMTNLPAFTGHIESILNSEPNEKDIIKMEITKEELVELIKSTVEAMNAASNEEKIEEDKIEEENKEEASEEKTEEVENSCKEEEKEVKNEEVESPVEETKEEVKETEEKTEEKKEEVKNEEADEEKKEKEVIKLEALNSAPTVGIGDSIANSCGWENKHGKAFFDELKKMGYRL